MKKFVSMILTGVLTIGLLPTVMMPIRAEEAQVVTELYEKGNFVTSYNPIVSRHVNGSSRAWRDGLISGNGEIGYVTSGEPYNDAFIFQYNFFNYPSSQPREIPAELTGQLEEARENVFNLNDDWLIRDANGNRRSRTFYYSYHPGHQLRLKSNYTDTEKDYIRWTNYETAETGVKFTDKYGTWKRVSFTSQTDGVSITKIEKSSEESLINMTISIDDIDDMCKAWDGMSKVSEQRYKKIVPDDGAYIAQIAHYPSYSASELIDGGYGGVTYIIAEGENATKTRITQTKDDPMLLGNNNAVEIKNAENVYLITVNDRTSSMTGQTANVMSKFESMTSYTLLDEMLKRVVAVKDKYTTDGKFSYDAALLPSAEAQKAEFNRMSFDLDGDEEYESYDNNALINVQRNTPDRINHEFMERAYEQARYAQICCGGSLAPRLYGMWVGEWNPGWRSIYTLDANVNLQVSAMNTGNLSGEFQYGYITYFLRHAPDFMYNAQMAYGMHDAIQLSVNTDSDRAMHVEYDNSYPFQYWNAGASWCLLPIFEYWQCFGNRQIPINENMRFENLQHVLGVNDGGLTDEEYEEIKNRGYLDLEKDILLPLLTKQANFWEQIVTPRYYIGADGKAHHDESKTQLNEGEKYMIIPTYSPENHPIGYYSTLTANATMDISAARDGLDMVCKIEEAVGRDGWEEAVEKWQTLKNNIADYKYDTDGALREWAMEEYEENNNHRHLSHLYVAWPAYDTQNDPDLTEASLKAINNRKKYNTGDATAGHGWMHQALVEARLKLGDSMMKSLMKMMNGTAYYSSMMTDHDTNRRNDTYCTDTAFGTLGAVNEALVFSNTGQIEIIPALPKDWTKGKVTGMMARTRVEIESLEWDIEGGFATVSLNSSEDDNTIRLSSGEAWTKATLDGEELQVKNDENGNYVEVTLNENEIATVLFTLSETPDGTYLIEEDGKYLQVEGIENGLEAIWGSLNDNAYWNVENTTEGLITIQSCVTGKYLTNENGVIVQRSYTGEENQKWSTDYFAMTRLNKLVDVIIAPDSIDITVDGEVVDAIELESGESVQLGTKIEPEGASALLTWSSDSIGSGVVLSNGKLTAYAPGKFNVSVTTDTGFTATVPVRVTGDARDAVKAEVINVRGADDGYNSGWVPQNAFDGIAGKAYASKDDASAKYIEAELKVAKAIDLVYVTGRFTGADGEGAYAKRINGAKVYASNTPWTGNKADAVLVGEITSVTATSAYIPARTRLDTKGEKYKYYTIYFDSVNNGSNISLAIDDIAFYTGGASYVQSLTPVVTAKGGANPLYATDGDITTMFKIENQTNYANEYIQFEFSGTETLNKIVVKKGMIALGGVTNYWGDHAYASGCVLEASLDGEAWETIYTMTKRPDGMDNQSEVVVNLEEPKAYKYVRYIRKEANSYVGWASNGGNKLILADIDFYTVGANVKAEIVKHEGKSLTVKLESNVTGTYSFIAAVYDGDKLIEVVTTPVDLIEETPREVEITTTKEGTVQVFTWGDNMVPIGEKITG
ncbi:MAG: glycoside hydrolase N-terminal domain-containing protein [Clostridia bacterium]|nr:glycoside hydrolase N-terminal domain-containing protein [Clostridia bacterium]